MKYRADIDGLRAVAVLAVVFFHARIPGFGGGYVGVDIFFVISGFLITSILVTAYDQGSYSILEFYNRRIRRIIPALIPVYIFSLVLAAMLYPPSTMASFGKSLLSSAVFISNITFHGEDGYFAAPSHEKPLLHTWSLSVEEQFYILWPLILFGILRLGSLRAKILLTVGLAIASLGLAEWWLAGDPSAAFFLFPARAWELLIGCFIALFLINQRPGIAVANLMSGTGIILIALAVIYFDERMRFPGASALAPCLGAGLLIYGGQNKNAWPNQMLASKGFVAIGLISYSLYLWHWPILAFGKYYLDRALDIPEAMVSVGVSFVLAFLSLRFIERPFRVHNAPPMDSRRVIAIGSVALAIIAVAGLAIKKSDGWSGRVPDALAMIDRYANEPSPLENECHGPPKRSLQNPKCIFGGTGNADDVSVLLIGDSHGNHFSPTLQRLAERDGFTARTITTHSCVPLFGVWQFRNQKRLIGCPGYMDSVWRVLRQSRRSLTVLIAARWSIHTKGYGLDDPPQPTWFISKEGSTVRTAENSEHVFRDALMATLVKITALGHKVKLIGQVPEYITNPQICAGKIIMLGGELERQSCAIGRKLVEAHFGRSREILMSTAAGNQSVEFIDLLPAICGLESCSPMMGDVFAYRDDNHLNPKGARLLAKHFPAGF